MGDVLLALGEVAGAVERAGSAVNDARDALGRAHAALTEATAGSNDQDAVEAPEQLAVATSEAGEVDELLHAILGKVSVIVGHMVNPDGTQVPSGTRAARAPVPAGRTPRTPRRRPSLGATTHGQQR
ncbi:hypothetical protein [Kutzneria sp. 744]|uniref:hypothetical protein n=1 Tax=Kutzneria sp. (strain 744) TaxID=345341 RepID=UPI0003EED251|nr:hypothetical protein [Kutzneria sp. 744]EWM16476.1 hypothetical protein KUTG_06780 [Kutzneria sp. 744]